MSQLVALFGGGDLQGRCGSVKWQRGLMGCICFSCEPSSLIPDFLGCEKTWPHFQDTDQGHFSGHLSSPGHTVSPETVSGDDPRLPTSVSPDIYLITAPWKPIIHFPIQFYTSITHINIRESAEIILPNVKGTANGLLLHPVCLLHWSELSSMSEVLIWKACSLSYSITY